MSCHHIFALVLPLLKDFISGCSRARFLLPHTKHVISPTYQRAFVKKRAFSSNERAVATGADLPFGRHHNPTWTAASQAYGKGWSRRSRYSTANSLKILDISMDLELIVCIQIGSGISSAVSSHVMQPLGAILVWFLHVFLYELEYY